MDLSTSNQVSFENHSDLPAPLILNCWKHHLRFLQRQIKIYASEGKTGLQSIVPKLLLIGNSQIDIYTGSLPEGKIASEVIEILLNTEVYEETEYVNWVNSANEEFKMIKLSDQSFWTLRLGFSRQRYIHIHPGRHTYNSVRVRANTLKTAILALISANIEGCSSFDIQLINTIRTKILELAPIKSVEKSIGLKNLITLLEKSSFKN